MTLVSRSRDSYKNAEQHMAMREREFLQCGRKQARTHICEKVVRVMERHMFSCYGQGEQPTDKENNQRSRCKVSLMRHLLPDLQAEESGANHPEKKKTVDVTIYRGGGTVNSFHRKVLGGHTGS